MTASEYIPTSLVLQVSFDVPRVTPAQRALAVGLVLLFFIVLTIVAYRLQYTELSEMQTRHKATLQGQREDTDPRTFRVKRGEDHGYVSDKVRDLVRRDKYDEGEDRMTLSRAVDQAVTTISEQFAGVPRYVAYGVIESLSIIVFGAMAVVSVEVWEYYAASQPGYPDPTVIIDYFHIGVEAGGDALFMFPFLSFFWSMLFAHTILLTDWLWHHWYITGTMLLVGTFAVFALDYKTPQPLSKRIYRFGPTDYVKVAFAVLGVWLAGVIPAQAGAYVGIPLIGGLIGVLAAFMALVYVLYLAEERIRKEISVIAKMHGDLADDPILGWLTVTYLLAWKTWAFFAVILLPILAMYVGYVLLTGRIFTLAGLMFSASTDVQVVLAVLAFAIILPFLYMIRSEWGGFRAAFGEGLARKRVRVALFARALPFGAMVATYIVAWGFGSSFIFAAVVAVVAGVAAVWLYRLFVRAKYRARMVEETNSVPETALVQVYPPLIDANDEEKYFVRVNGVGLAHDTLSGEAKVESDTEVVENIGDAAQKAVEDLFEHGEIEPTLATWHAKNMFKWGIVDVEDTRKKLIQKMRREIFPRLRQNGGGMVTAEIRDELREYPANLSDEKWTEWHVHGTEEGRLVNRGDWTVLVP